MLTLAWPNQSSCDVGLVPEGVDGRGRPQHVDDAFHGDAGDGSVLAGELVDAVAGERPACPVSLGRLEQGCLPVVAVACELKVLVQGQERGRVDRHRPALRSLHGHAEVRHASVLVERSNREADDLVAPESVVEQGSEQHTVASGLEAFPRPERGGAGMPGHRRAPACGLRTRSRSGAT